MLGSTKYTPKHFSSPLWIAKKARLLRYHGGKIGERGTHTDAGTKEHSVQTNNMMNMKKLGPFAKIFAIQSFIPKGHVYDERKLAISQRSSSGLNEMPWQGRTRWRQFFWNGGAGSTGVRREYAIYFPYCLYF